MAIATVNPKRRMALTFCGLALCAGAPVALSQSAVGDGRLISFEHASVLPSHPAAGPIVTISPASGEFTAHGVSLRRLIGYAYDVPPSRVVGGPEWVESARFEVRGYPPPDFNADGSPVTTDEVRPLVIGLLADYFGLEARIEEAPLETVYIDRVGDPPQDESDGGFFEVVPRPSQKDGTPL